MGRMKMVVNVLRGRWFMVFACLLILGVAGATYIFGIYSEVIKTSLGYDQETLNTIGFSKDLGGNVGIVSGLIQEVMPPWVVLALGAGMNLFGYIMIWLAVTGRTAPPPVWQICVYIFLGANSQAFANTGALVTCVKNFPRSRGVVLGLLKGLMGLSGAILTQLYHAFYGDDAEAFILFLAWLPTAVSIVFVYSVREINAPRQGNETRMFYKFLYVVLLLVAYLMVVIVVQNQVHFSMPMYRASAAVILLLAFLPLIFIIREEMKNNSNVVENAQQPDELTSSSPRSSSSSITEHRPQSCFANMFQPPPRGEDYTIMQALVSIDMLTIFITTTCGVGGTLAAIDNLGQIGKSLGYPPHGISTCVSLVSIWNCLGRLTGGFASEIFITRYKLPRPLILTVVLLFACAGHLLIAFAPPNALYVASVIVGFTFGAQWPVIYAVISELFGLKYYSTLYNFGGMASPVGSYILNVLVAGKLYDRVATRQTAESGVVVGGKELNCVGGECFRLSFLIITAATLFGAAVSLILVGRTYSFYKGDIYAKFREQAEEVEMAEGPSSKANTIANS